MITLVPEGHSQVAPRRSIPYANTGGAREALDVQHGQHVPAPAERAGAPGSLPAAAVERPAFLRARAPLAFCLMLVLTIALQHLAGAYQSERGSNSDEAAHLMNGLLLRDYLLEGLHQHPLEYAEAYYLNYPKIAPGMWPPLFHVLLGLLLLIGRSPQITALLFVAAATSWTAFRLWSISTQLAGSFVASILAALFLLTPAVIDVTSAVMLDAAVAALALEATYWLARYAASRQRAHAVLFGLFAALCCLTKGNGLAVLLAPALLVLVTRRFRLLQHSGLYISALIVILFALPWVWYSYRLDAAIGDFGPVTADVVRARLHFYGLHVFRQLGVGVMLLGGLGALISLARSPDDAGLRSTLPAALAALILAGLLFHLFNPHISVAERYMTLTLAPMLGLAGVAAVSIARLASTAKWRRVISAALLVLLVTGSMAARPATAKRLPLGWREAAIELQSAGALEGQRLLVVADESGEGAFVSEVAVTAPSPRATVVRGSKLLATDDWNGNHLHLTFTSASALMRELEDLHVDYLVVDASAESQALPYWPLVRDLLANEGERVELFQSTVGGRSIFVYRLKYRSNGPAKKLRFNVSGLRSAVAQR